MIIFKIKLSMLTKLLHFLFKPINPSVVNIYRIVFGCFMFYQMMYYYDLDYTYQFMAGPEVLFPYRGFEFLQPLPIEILKVIHFLLLISTVLITLGLWYRYAVIFFFIGFSYFSFIDKTLYNNHIYLFSLIAFVMIFLNADTNYSIRYKRSKQIIKNVIPAWNQYILIFLISLPYFFGGIAKLSFNWLNTDLAKVIYNQTNGSVLYNLLPENIFIFLIKYGGLIYDLIIVFLLLNKKTRKYGIILLLIFNLTNSNLLFNDIGIFPLLMICSTILFFDSSKVGEFISDLMPKRPTKKLSKRELKLDKKRKKKELVSKHSNSLNFLNQNIAWTKSRKITTICIGVFILFHLIFPFRHFLLTNNPEWTGLGSRFAWRMKMQSKEITEFNMTLIDRGNNASGDITVASFLSKNQMTHIAEDPYNIIHLAKYLQPLIEKKYNILDPKITVDLKVKFNGFDTQNLISTEADLVKLSESPFANNEWIMPLIKNK